MTADRILRPLRPLGAVLLLILAGAAAAADTPHHGDPPPRFVASTAKPFDALMHDAMAVMEHGMSTARMTGNTDHDFVAMMIPHHQGAVDMAKALLLYTKDPELINLAQGIITEQENEIRLMRAWLARHGEAAPAK